MLGDLPKCRNATKMPNLSSGTARLDVGLLSHGVARLSRGRRASHAVAAGAAIQPAGDLARDVACRFDAADGALANLSVVAHASFSGRDQLATQHLAECEPVGRACRQQPAGPQLELMYRYKYSSY